MLRDEMRVRIMEERASLLASRREVRRGRRPPSAHRHGLGERARATICSAGQGVCVPSAALDASRGRAGSLPTRSLRAGADAGCAGLSRYDYQK